MRTRILPAAALLAATSCSAPQPPVRADAATARCDTPVKEPIVHVAMPGNPFQALPTRDGCAIIVSLPQLTASESSGALAVLRRTPSGVSVAHLIPVAGNPLGMAITHDERLLAVTNGDDVLFVDVPMLLEGRREAVLGRLTDGRGAGRVYAGITNDDALLFVADERALGISVIDLARARASSFAASAIIGKIATGRAPIAVTPSPDGRYLYATSQEAPRAWNWPISCLPQTGESTTPNHPEGAIWVVDLARARQDPSTSVVSTVAAGCNPVRLVLSPNGGVAYVTARAANSVLAFDTEKLRTDTAHARIGTVPVGTAPVGVAVYDGGRRVLVTNSNRFAGEPTDRQYLTLVEASRIRDGASAVLGTIPAGAFPRELRVTADGTTLVLTNFASRTVQLVDLARVTLAPPR